MSDAILRTLFRLTVSHRNMLDWVTAAQTKVNPQLDLVGFYRQMAGGVALATGCRDSRRLRRAGLVADCGAVPDTLAVVARHSAMDKLAVVIVGSRANFRIRHTVVALSCAPHLALLRNLRHGGGSHAPA